MLPVKQFSSLAMATLVALIVTLAAALPGVSADGGVDKNNEAAQGEQQAPPSRKGRIELPQPGLPPGPTGGQRGSGTGFGPRCRL